VLIETTDWQRRVCTLHVRYWAQKGRSEYCRSALLRFLRCSPACRRCAGTQVWHGGLGANVHAAVGTEYHAARMGQRTVAAVHSEDCHRMSGRYGYQARVLPRRTLTSSSRLLSRHCIVPLPLLHTFRVWPPPILILRPGSRRWCARRRHQLLRLQTLSRPARRRLRQRIAVALVAGPVPPRGQPDGHSRAGGILLAAAQRRDSMVPHA